MLVQKPGWCRGQLLEENGSDSVVLRAKRGGLLERVLVDEG